MDHPTVIVVVELHPPIFRFNYLVIYPSAVLGRFDMRAWYENHRCGLAGLSDVDDETSVEMITWIFPPSLTLSTL